MLGSFWLRFGRLLEDFTWSHTYPEAGSIAFHRWLPDSENDALVLPIEWRGTLNVWFERCGYVDESGFVRFDRKRREVDQASLRRQAVVFSGPLHGLLQLEEVEPQDLESVRRGTAVYEEQQRTKQVPFQTEYYIDFGKRVAKILGPPLARLFDFLRFSYGQYWIPTFRPWNSKFQNLGAFFASLFAEWSDDEGKSWHPFRPAMPEHVTVMPAIPWAQFLTEQDWRELAKALQAGLEPGVAVKALSRSNRFLDEDEDATALVEGVTALEIAIREYVNRRLERSEVPEIADFNELTRTSQLKVVLAILDPPVESDLAKNAIKAIEQRNDFVHRGILPPESADENVKAVLHVAARLLEPPGPKLPQWTLGSRMLYPPDPS